ncbi:MAG: FAD-dependent thymidylate synthase [[Clostridium] leptum]
MKGLRRKNRLLCGNAVGDRTREPIEHASFTLASRVSRSFLAQVTRHRMASFGVQSQRYVKEVCLNTFCPRRSRASRRPGRNISGRWRRTKPITTALRRF